MPADGSITPFQPAGWSPEQDKGAKTRGDLVRDWVGQTIADKYRVVRLLGSGGAAEVYEAEHAHLCRRVAIKLLHSQLAIEPVMMERFKQEARLVSLITHPNVVRVEDFGTLADGTLYMVMELLEGQTVAEAIDAGSIECAAAIDVTIQACQGLGAAHEHDVIHRDVKPANLFLHRAAEDGSESTVVKVVDLGIAKLRGQEPSNLTMTGSIFGTPEYIAPEQALGALPGPSVDIYSLGVTLYELLLGRVPFTAASFMAVLTRHLAEPPEWPEELAALRGVPSEAKLVVLKALAKNPDHRYASMREFEAALSELRSRVKSAPAGSARPALVSAGVQPGRRPSSFTRTDLGRARGTDREVVEIAPEVYWVGRRHGVLLECNTYLRVFRGEGQQLAVLIDPGPPKDLEVVTAKVKSVLGSLARVDLVFLNHQDPDLAINAASIQAFNPRAHVVCSEDTWRLVQFYGLNPRAHSATEHFTGNTMRLATGHSLNFVPTPYCHFRGAVALYDPQAEVLFTGDLLGGVSRSPGLRAVESDWSEVELFHQLYMPSQKALRHAATRIQRLQPMATVIAPQHGAVITGALVSAWLGRLSSMQVGADLLVDEDEKARYLGLVHDLLTAVVELMGKPAATQLLWRYTLDGTFPNLFVFRGTLEVVEFKVDPRAAVRALHRDALAAMPGELAPALAQALDQALDRHGLRRHFQAPEA